MNFIGKIAIEGMLFRAFHGYYEEEKVLGGEYRVDVIIETDIETAAKKDDLKGTINYAAIYALVEKEMKKRSKLIEHVAYRIAEVILSKFKIEKVMVRVSKLNPPVLGRVQRVYVELEKGKIKKR